jgi:tryptophan halogenase
MLAASAPKFSTLPAFSQISAFNRGWVGLFPLQSRTAIVAAYRSDAISDGEVAELASVVARMPISGEAVVSELRPGIQRRPWIGNCVAIGHSAIAVGPLDALDLHVTHGCISHLMALFPATAGEFPEAEAYNRSIRSFGLNLRDFQASHYLLNRRFDDPLWDRVRESEIPASLKRRVDMFDARAVVPLNDDETFYEQAWAGLLLGNGINPKAYDPRVDLLSDEAHILKVQQRLRDVAALAKQMPSVNQFLGLEQRASAGVSG